MNSFELWRYAAFGLIALIVVGCLILIVGMYLDVKRRESRNVAAPDLGMSQKNNGAIFGNTNVNGTVGNTKTKSRKELRNSKPGNVSISIDNVDKSSFFEQSDEAFSLNNGKD